MIIKLILLLLVVGVIPLYYGAAVSKGLNIYQDRGATGVLFYFLFGSVCLWGIFQVVTVPLILLKQPFTHAVWLWGIVTVVLLMTLLTIYRTFWPFGKPHKIIISWQWLLVILMLCIIGFQVYQYVFKMHIDDDDSRFVVTAVEAYEKNTMMLIHPTNGELMDTFIGERVKDVPSPWMLYIALIGKLVSIHPTILAHTVMPGIWLLMVYGVFWLLGDYFFKQGFVKTCLFVSFTALVIQYYGGHPWTQGSFTLVRIWQGKAMFAALLIPFLLLNFLNMMQQKENTKYWVALLAGDLACCLMSGVGISLGGGLTLFYAFYDVVANRRWKRFWTVPLACLPSIVYGIIYLKIS